MLVQLWIVEFPLQICDNGVFVIIAWPDSCAGWSFDMGLKYFYVVFFTLALVQKLIRGLWSRSRWAELHVTYVDHLPKQCDI